MPTSVCTIAFVDLLVLELDLCFTIKITLKLFINTFEALGCFVDLSYAYNVTGSRNYLNTDIRQCNVIAFLSSLQ